MRDPDCILVRVGEQALKSEQVQKKWMAILLDNIRTELQMKKIKFSFEVNPNRVFIYSKERGKVKSVLKRVFGVTSYSECWKCHSGLDEIKLLSVDLAEHIKLTNKQSFAIRARRAGWHKFSSQTVAEEAGAAVKRVTNAKVNLRKPKKEIFIEVRSRNTYIFTKKINGLGGLPLGTGGDVGIKLRNNKDVLAAWLIMRRGCTLIADDKKPELLKKIRKWHVGKKIIIVKKLEDFEIKAMIVAGKISEKQKSSYCTKKTLILRPLDGLDTEEKSDLTRLIG